MEEDPETAAPPRPQITQNGFLEPSERMTLHQFFYTFIVDGIGAFILSGGINFAIAYGMYAHEKNTIHLFELPSTLAGDAAVTIIIQCIITWLIELMLVNGDLKTGRVQPIGFLAEPTNKLLRWYLFLDPEQAEEEEHSGGLLSWVQFLVSQVVRALVAAFFSFCLLWGPCVGILIAVGVRDGGDWKFDRIWAPQIFKGLLGGVLGILTTPAFTVFWLAKCGWRLKKGEEDSRSDGDIP